jgi:hypothetical protein
MEKALQKYQDIIICHIKSHCCIETLEALSKLSAERRESEELDQIIEGRGGYSLA